MNVLKIIQTLTLATLLVLALGACSNKDTNDTNATGQTTGTSQGGGEDGATNMGAGGNAGVTTNSTGSVTAGTDGDAEVQDVTPPNITLNGEASITLEQNAVYTELGATAVDAVDGNVSVSISGSVDTDTVGSYTVTYTAQDSAGNEASVSREVVVESKYKILITRKKGHTANYGRSAYFTISLSHKPTHPVEIFIESDNPNEGIVPKKESWGWDMKTGRIVIHPKDWKRGEQIVIKGRNKNVINGKQDYHIVTSPAVSEDPHFDGVDAEDVWMRGEVLELSKPDLTHKPFVPGVLTRFYLYYAYNGNILTPISIRFLKKPEGMVLENGKAIVWKPKESDGGKNYDVVLEISNKTLKSTMQFKIQVAKLSNPLATIVKENKIIVPNTKECKFSGNGEEFSLTLPKKFAYLAKEIKFRRLLESNLYMYDDIEPLSCVFTMSVPDEINKVNVEINVSLPLYGSQDYDNIPRLYSYYDPSLLKHYNDNWYWDGYINRTKFKANILMNPQTTIKRSNMSGDLNTLYFIGKNKNLKSSSSVDMHKTHTSKKSKYFLKVCNAKPEDEHNLSKGFNYNLITCKKNISGNEDGA